MPDTLCRTCGGELTARDVCTDCRQPLQFFCNICKNKSDTRIHTFCLSGSSQIDLENKTMVMTV